MTAAILKREDVYVLKGTGELVSYDDYEAHYHEQESKGDSLVHVVDRDDKGAPLVWIPYTL